MWMLSLSCKAAYCHQAVDSCPVPACLSGFRIPQEAWSAQKHITLEKRVCLFLCLPHGINNKECIKALRKIQTGTTHF